MSFLCTNPACLIPVRYNLLKGSLMNGRHRLGQKVFLTGGKQESDWKQPF